MDDHWCHTRGPQHAHREIRRLVHDRPRQVVAYRPNIQLHAGQPLSRAVAALCVTTHWAFRARIPTGVR
jgi:hypothetical protein